MVASHCRITDKLRPRPPSLSGIENGAPISAAGVARGAYMFADPLDEANLFGRLAEERPESFVRTLVEPAGRPAPATRAWPFWNLFLGLGLAIL
jgi:hypothetical protein